MTIKESKLRSIIKGCIRNVLNEGYSSKGKQEEIVSIAKEIYNAIIENGQTSYNTSLKSKIDDNSWAVTNVNAILSDEDYAYANRRGVTIEITKNTDLNTIAKLLMHEFTHIFDTRINKKTRFNDGDLYSGVNNMYDIPRSIRDIVYHLWIPTEFNAFQTTYDFRDENFNAMFERFMGYIEEAYNMPTTKSLGWKDNYEEKWKTIQYQLRGHLPRKYQKCNAETFKEYFIKKSMMLLKKLVKKWDGQQNTNFV